MEATPDCKLLKVVRGPEVVEADEEFSFAEIREGCDWETVGKGLLTDPA